MSEPLKQFLKVADKVDADKRILSETVVQNILDDVEDFGKDLGEDVENLFKSSSNIRPPKPAVPTPTYQESAFLAPKQETTLYNVTNRKEEVPEVTKKSNIFKKISYTFKGFTASANLKNGNDKYRVYLGEKAGVGYEVKEGGAKTAFSALYNVRNGKSSLNYSFSRPGQTYGVSVFNKDSNNGVTAYYSVENVKSRVSVDKSSISLNCSYTKKYEDCTVELNTYVTTGESHSNHYAGIGGRVTF